MNTIKITVEINLKGEQTREMTRIYTVSASDETLQLALIEMKDCLTKDIKKLFK